MKNFRRIETGVSTEQFLEEIRLNKDKVEYRKTPGVHRESKHIVLRSGERTSRTMNWYHGNILKNGPTSNYVLFPRITEWMERFAQVQKGSPQRAFIAILEPHGQVHSHFDAGLYPAFWDRYHFVLETKGTRVVVADEEVIFAQGDVWWFNNLLFHEFHNDSEKERIHFIFDLKPDSISRRIPRLVRWVYRITIHRIRGATKTGSPSITTSPV